MSAGSEASPTLGNVGVALFKKGGSTRPGEAPGVRSKRLWFAGFSGWPRCGGRGPTHPRQCEDVSSGRFRWPDFPQVGGRSLSLLLRRPWSEKPARGEPQALSVGLVRTRTTAPRPCAPPPVDPPLAAIPPIGGLVLAPHLVGGATRRRRSARSRPQRGAHHSLRRLAAGGGERKPRYGD